MSSQKDYVPVQLIIKIGDRLLAVDGLGHQVYSARYLEKNHLSGRAQCHFRHHESVSVMQLYAAVRRHSHPSHQHLFCLGPHSSDVPHTGYIGAMLLRLLFRCHPPSL